MNKTADDWNTNQPLSNLHFLIPFGWSARVNSLVNGCQTIPTTQTHIAMSAVALSSLILVHVQKENFIQS